MLRLSLLAALSLVVATPAAAQDAVADLLANPREAEDRGPAGPAPVDGTEAADKPAYDPQTEEVQRLNAAVAAHNQSVRQANAAAQAEYEQALRDHQAWVERLEAEHQAEQAAYDAEVLRRRQAHEADLAAWRARVEACQRGVVAACEPSPR